MRNLEINFKIFDLDRNFFYEFLTQNDFANFRCFIFVKIQTSGSYKK